MLGQWCSSTEPQLGAPHLPAQGPTRAKTPPCPIPVWTSGRSCLPRARIASGDPCPSAYGPQDTAKNGRFLLYPRFRGGPTVGGTTARKGVRDDPDQPSKGEPATSDDRPARRA